MNCPKCGRPAADQARFCPACGSALQAQTGFSYSAQRKKNRQKKMILVALSVVCLVAACAGGAWYFLREDPREAFAETIAYAEKYLTDQDYQRAEEYYTKAMTIDPKQKDPYEKLYEIYTATEQETKAQDIEQKAQENLEPEDQVLFAQAREEITEAWQPVNRYTILADLGSLDRTPVSIRDEIWLVQKDGKYSFLNTQGETVNDFSTEAAMILPYMNPNSQEREFPVCLPQNPDDSTSVTSQNQWPYSSSPVNRCTGFGGTGQKLVYTLNDQDEVVEGNQLGNEFTPTGSAELSVQEPFFLSRQGSSDGSFYIYSPALDQVSGPYDKGETPGFALLARSWQDLQFHPVELSFLDQLVYGPYWTRTQDGDAESYTVISQDGSTEKSGFDQAVVTDWSSMGVFEKTRYTLLDADLSPLYTGRFEAGARPIDGVAPVKIDGSWKLVRFGDMVRARDYQGENSGDDVPEGFASAEKENKENRETEEPKQEDENDAARVDAQQVLRSAAGTYFRRGSGWSCQFTVNQDGTFTAQWSDRARGDTGTDYPNGTEYVNSLSGRLAVQPESPQSPWRVLEVSEVSMDHAPDTSEIHDGIRTVYTDASAYGFETGKTIIIYPQGTEFSMTSGYSQNWLEQNQRNESVLSSPVLDFPDPGIAYLQVQ